MVNIPGSPSFLRVIRIIRILRLFRFIPRLRAFVETLIFVMPSALNVVLLLGTVIFIFAIVGMNILGELPFGVYINSHRNFASFGHSLLTVFVMGTGDGWADVMSEAMQTSPWYAIYFVSLTVRSDHDHSVP